MNSSAVNLLELGSKAQSKSEIYRLLVVEGGMNLPPEDQCSMDFVSDICFQDRKVMFSEDIKVCSVPHVDGLGSADLISFIVHDCNGEVYLPRNYIEYTPNRTLLANICNSLDFEGFQHIVKEVLSERQKKLLEKNNLSINIDQRIALIFESSNMVATTKEVFAEKRKGKKISDAEIVKQDLDSIPNLMNEITDLKNEIMLRDA